jgi:putative FmdB family regulatory protein
MPTYEYYCEKCGVFETFHSITTSLDECPQCHGPVRRLISQNNNIIFKGSGFYTTDNRSSSSHPKKSSADSGSGSSTAASSTSDSKTESKAS